jgi:hypothetical protein
LAGSCIVSLATICAIRVSSSAVHAAVSFVMMVNLLSGCA